MTQQAFEAQFAALGGELIHHMPDDGSGVYIKQTRIPAGTTLAMHRHSFTHKSVLCSGMVIVTADGVPRTLEAPAVLAMPEGVEHAVCAVTDAVWLCIHATKVLDPDAIDHELTGGRHG